MDTRDESRPAEASATNSGAGTAGESRSANERRPAAARAAAEAYDKARERTASAYAEARSRAGSAYERAGRGLEANPLAAVLGGIAVGAAIAVLVPRGRREAELLGPVGRKINDGALDAARAARETAREKLDQLGMRGEGTIAEKAAGAVQAAGAVADLVGGTNKS